MNIFFLQYGFSLMYITGVHKCNKRTERSAKIMVVKHDLYLCGKICNKKDRFIN